MKLQTDPQSPTPIPDVLAPDTGDTEQVEQVLTADQIRDDIIAQDSLPLSMEEEPIVLHSAVSDSESNNSQEIVNNDELKSSENQFKSTSEINNDNSTPSSTFPFNVESDVNKSAANNVNSNVDSESGNSITDVTMNDVNISSIGESDRLNAVMLHDHCYSSTVEPPLVPKSSSHTPPVTGGVLQIIPLVSLISNPQQLLVDPLSAVSFPVFNIDVVPSTGSGNIPSTGSDTIPSTGSDNIPSTGFEDIPSTGSDNILSTGSDDIRFTGSDNIPPTSSGDVLSTNIDSSIGSGNIPPTGSESFEIPEAISQELFTSNESVSAATMEDHGTNDDLQEEEEERAEETEKEEEIHPLQSLDMEQVPPVAIVNDDGPMGTEDTAPCTEFPSYDKKLEVISDVPPYLVAQYLQAQTDSIDDDEELKKVAKICLSIANTYFQKE